MTKRVTAKCHASGANAACDGSFLDAPYVFPLMVFLFFFP